MPCFRNLVLAASAGSIALIGVQASPAHAAIPAHAHTTVPHSLLVGELGFEGGAYPGPFHPTAGTVEVSNQTFGIEATVGRSGQFKFGLPPGKYKVIGCGPSTAAGSSNGQCSKPKTVTLTAGDVRFVKLVWAFVP